MTVIACERNGTYYDQFQWGFRGYRSNWYFSIDRKHIQLVKTVRLRHWYLKKNNNFKGWNGQKMFRWWCFGKVWRNHFGDRNDLQKFSCVSLNLYHQNAQFKYPYHHEWKLILPKKRANWSKLKNSHIIVSIIQFCISIRILIFCFDKYSESQLF